MTIEEKFDTLWDMQQHYDAEHSVVDYDQIIPHNSKALRHWIEMLNYIKHNEQMQCRYIYQEERLQNDIHFQDEVNFTESIDWTALQNDKSYRDDVIESWKKFNVRYYFPINQYYLSTYSTIDHNQLSSFIHSLSSITNRDMLVVQDELIYNDVHDDSTNSDIIYRSSIKDSHNASTTNILTFEVSSKERWNEFWEMNKYNGERITWKFFNNFYSGNYVILDNIIKACLRRIPLQLYYRQNGDLNFKKSCTTNIALLIMENKNKNLLLRYWKLKNVKLGKGLEKECKDLKIMSNHEEELFLEIVKDIILKINHDEFIKYRDNLNNPDHKDGRKRSNYKIKSKSKDPANKFIIPMLSAVTDNVYQLNTIEDDMDFKFRINTGTYYSGRCTCCITSSKTNDPLWKINDMYREKEEKKSVSRAVLLKMKGLVDTNEDKYDIHAVLPNLLRAYNDPDSKFIETDCHTETMKKHNLSTRNIAKLGAFRGIFNCHKSQSKFLHDVLYSFSPYKDKSINYENEMVKAGIKIVEPYIRKGILTPDVITIKNDTHNEYVQYILDNINSALACREEYNNDLYPSDLFIIESAVETETLLYFARQGHRVGNAYDHIYTDGTIDPVEFKAKYAENATKYIKIYKSLRNGNK